MKYRVHATDRCYAHVTGSQWDSQRWPYITMTRDAVYDDNDVCLWPGGKWHKDDSWRGPAPDAFPQHYGFRLPPNSKNIDFIIVHQADVELINRGAAAETVRRLHEQNGSYSFPGYIPRK